MKCLYCGSEIPDRSTFCLDCGSPVVGEDPEFADMSTELRRRRAFKKRVVVASGIALCAAAATIIGAVVAVRYARKRSDQLRSTAANAARRLIDQIDPQ